MERQIEMHWSRLTPNPLNRLVRGEGEEDVGEMAASIKANGVIEPLGVMSSNDNGYVIIYGEQRWRAVRLLGDEAPLLPCIVKPPMSALDQLVTMGVENIQRNGLSPIAQARYYHALYEAICEEKRQAASRAGVEPVIKRPKIVGEMVRRTGIRRDRIEGRMKLLALHAHVLELMERGAIPVRAAPHLEKLPLEVQGQIADKLVGRSLAGIENAVRIILERMEREATRVTGAGAPAGTNGKGPSVSTTRGQATPKSVTKNDVETALRATCAACEAQREMRHEILWESIAATGERTCRRCDVRDIKDACQACPLVEFLRDLRQGGAECQSDR